MFDSLPAPYGTVTRRWSSLPDDERDRHARRLLDVPAEDVKLDGSTPTATGQYRRVAAAAVDGDPIAIALVAITHRPLLLTRGRPIFDHDPVEWGLVSLELLYDALAETHASNGVWLRRAVVLRLTQGMARLLGPILDHRRAERAIDPTDLSRLRTGAVDPTREPHLDLTIAMRRTMGRLDPATRAALYAIAHRQSLAPVSAAHDLSPEALRQRVHRARTWLRPALAEFHRSAA